MQTILSLPFAAFIAVVLLFVLFCIGAGLALVWYLGRLPGSLSERLPAATFVAVTSTAWALSLGFAASDIFSLQNRADQAALAERSAILRIIGAAAPEALNWPTLVEAANHYAQSVVDREWSQLHNRVADAEVDKAVQVLRVQIMALHDQGVPDVILGKVIRDFDELQDARNLRLAIGESAVDDTKWLLILMLSVVTALNIALVNAGTPKAARNALAVFGVTMLLCFVILGLNADPYRTMRSTLVYAQEGSGLASDAVVGSLPSAG